MNTNPIGRTPVNVVCAPCGLVWCSVDSGREWTQPPSKLFKDHPEAVLSTTIRNGDGRAKATFQGWSRNRRQKNIGGLR
jgi:hypothetical protein